MGGVAAAEEGGGRRGASVGRVDGGLEGEEGFLRGGFRVVVAGDGDVDDAAGGDGGGEEDGGEFDLRGKGLVWGVEGWVQWGRMVGVLVFCLR